MNRPYTFYTIVPFRVDGGYIGPIKVKDNGYHGLGLVQVGRDHADKVFVGVLVTEGFSGACRTNHRDVEEVQKVSCKEIGYTVISTNKIMITIFFFSFLPFK